MAYASVAEALKGFRELSEKEVETCEDLLEEAGIIIDAYNASAEEENKKRVSIRMVRRALGDGEGAAFPIGATQGSVSALGYSQSWTIGSSGSTGETYLNRVDKKILGIRGKIGSCSPLEDLAND